MGFFNFNRKEKPSISVASSQEKKEKYFNILTTPDREIKEMLLQMCSPYNPTPNDISKIKEEIAEIKSSYGGKETE